MTIKIDLRNDSRKVRSDKKVRVNASLDQDTHRKLKKLSISCDMTKTTLAAEIIKIAVNHTEIIKWLQDQYNKEEEYRIIPIKTSTGTIY